MAPKAAEEPETAIISWHTDGALPPVVFFHSWTADAGHLRHLADELGPDQPLYGIEHPPTDGPLPDDLTGWVRHHRRGLDQLPVSSPYHLAGFSFAGVVALEIAMALRADGAEIGWLGLIDTIRPKLNPQGLRPYLGYHVRELLDEPSRDRRRAHATRMVLGGGRRTLLRARHQLLRPVRGAGILRDANRPTLADARGLSPLKKAVWRGYLDFRATHYDAPVALFTGVENLALAGGDPSLRWSRYLRGGLEVVPLPGPHQQMLEPPHVAVAAREIRASLARAADRRAGA